MIHYTATLVIFTNGTAPLVKKRFGPPQLKGLWNLIGGKVEPDENILEAHIREFKEEVGVILNPENFKRNIALCGEGFTLHCALVVDTPTATIPKTNDVGEELLCLPLSEHTGLVPNLKWIIPLLTDREFSGVVVT